MRSPFDTFGVNTWSGGGDGGSTLNSLRSLARTLASVQANATNVATAVSVIETKRLSVWAVPVPTRMSETMTGVQNSPSAGTFRYRASGPLGQRDLGTLTGASAASGLPWTGMAFWDGTSFRGIVVWSWTADTIDASGEVINPAARPVTTPAMMFHPQLGDGLFRRIKTIIIEADGTLTLNATDTTTGFQFSSAQDPTANGYYSTSFFSRDDGVWGIQPNARLDGDTPGPALTTGGYGISAYQSSEPVNSYYWGGTAQASSNYVGVVFSA